MLAMLLMMLGGQDAGTLVANARAMTAAEQRCTPDSDSTDITVCGLRRADRYRVPFIVHDDGDPRHQSVAAEREHLLHPTNRIQDMSAFLVETGMAGVTVGTGGVTGATKRKLAP